MVPKLFVCIERHVRYPTMSCDLDPEETLLYSKVTMPPNRGPIWQAIQNFVSRNNLIVQA